MCKVFGVAGVNDKNRGSIIQIMKDISPSMTKMEKDGIGYAAMDKDGNIFGEKWLKPEHAFKIKKKRVVPASEVVSNLDQAILSQFQDVIDHSPSEKYSRPIYDKFGEGNLKDAVAFVLHSRFSTGTDNVTIENVHPFVNQGSALIHNGIVYNENKFMKTISSCDSEVLLNQYNLHNVNMDSRNLTEALLDVDAYFACLVLSQTIMEDSSVVPILDVFQNGASLKIIHVHNLNATFFLTSATDLVELCKKKGWTTSRYYDVKEDVLIRLNAITGQVIEKEQFYYYGRKNYNYNNSWTKDEKETYYKSRYGEDYVKYIGENNDAPDEEPDYRKLETNEDDKYDYTTGHIYDATQRMPHEEEMEVFRKMADHGSRKQHWRE